jgi:predicted branched-subunit amino acid permease
MRAALDNLRQVPKLMNRLAFPQLPWWIVWLAYLVLMLMFAGCKMRSKRLLACLSWVACWLLVAVFFYRWMPLTPLVVVMLASAIIPPKKRHGDVAGNEVLSDAG